MSSRPKTVPLAALMAVLTVLGTLTASLVAFLVHQRLSNQAVDQISVQLRRNTCVGSAEYVQRNSFDVLDTALDVASGVYVHFTSARHPWQEMARPVPGPRRPRLPGPSDAPCRRWFSAANSTGVISVGVVDASGAELSMFIGPPYAAEGRAVVFTPDPAARPGSGAALMFRLTPDGPERADRSTTPSLFRDPPSLYARALAASPGPQRPFRAFSAPCLGESPRAVVAARAVNESGVAVVSFAAINLLTFRDLLRARPDVLEATDFRAWVTNDTSTDGTLVATAKYGSPVDGAGRPVRAADFGNPVFAAAARIAAEEPAPGAAGAPAPPAPPFLADGAAGASGGATRSPSAPAPTSSSARGPAWSLWLAIPAGALYGEVRRASTAGVVFGCCWAALLSALAAALGCLAPPCDPGPGRQRRHRSLPPPGAQLPTLHAPELSAALLTPLDRRASAPGRLLSSSALETGAGAERPPLWPALAEEPAGGDELEAATPPAPAAQANDGSPEAPVAASQGHGASWAEHESTAAGGSHSYSAPLAAEGPRCSSGVPHRRGPRSIGAARAHALRSGKRRCSGLRAAAHAAGLRITEVRLCREAVCALEAGLASLKRYVPGEARRMSPAPPRPPPPASGAG
eukprot:tig00001415_g8672.t1